MSAARFENQAVVITGGGGGIGRAAALAFAREGANVVVADLHEGNAAETLRQIEQAGGRATVSVTA